MAIGNERVRISGVEGGDQAEDGETMAKTAVYYEVCQDEPGEPPFMPISGSMEPDKAKALRELKEMRRKYSKRLFGELNLCAMPGWREEGTVTMSKSAAVETQTKLDTTAIEMQCK